MTIIPILPDEWSDLTKMYLPTGESLVYVRGVAMPTEKLLCTPNDGR